MTLQPTQQRREPDSLADVLERVLDKGIVIAGDIVVDVLDIELLSIKLRLFVCSAQTAVEMGMDWWKHDPFFTSAGRDQVDGGGKDGKDEEIASLRRRLRELESRERDT